MLVNRRCLGVTCGLPKFQSAAGGVLCAVAVLLAGLAEGGCAAAANAPVPPEIKDKTLVAWVYPANLTQRGGSVLTIDQRSTFDGIVFGECAPGKWMAGSNNYLRTQQDQGSNAAETAGPETLVQIAVVYSGKHVALYRNGTPYAAYDTAEPQIFEDGAVAVIGLRHLDRRGAQNAYFAGAVEEARIYNTALSAEDLAKLAPNTASQPAPLACWTFEDGSLKDSAGTFGDGILVGGAKIENGRLVLDGVDDYMMTPGNTAVGAASPLHFRPAAGVMADTIPFFWKGEYHIFYLRGSIGKVPWEHVVSTDLIHWRELPTALVSDGAEDSPDGCHMFTGSVVEHDGTFHIYYTGHNPKNPEGQEFTMHATSPDLITWTKHPEDKIGPDGVIYANKPQNRNWRDSYVFWNDAEKQFWMLVIADSIAEKKPVQGLLISKDLKTWTYEKPLEDADGQECPDLFQIGDTWYLIGGDHYLSAKNPRGPYTRPAFCMIDRPGVYAAKRMFDGTRHIWSGWAWDTSTLRDGDNGIWGGDQCLPREIYPGPDGQLFCKPAREIEAAFPNPAALQPETLQGTWKNDGDRLTGVTEGGGKAACRYATPSDYMFTCTFRLDPNANISFLMRQNAARDRAYRFTVRPGVKQAALSGENINRVHDNVIVDTGKPVTVKGFVLGSLVECFINDSYAFTRRAYNLHAGDLGIEVENGGVEILDMRIGTPAPAAVAPLPFDDSGFVPLFDGKTLTGWESPDMSYWTVEDGAITGRISKEHPLTVNQYLVWEGGAMDDYELKMNYRMWGDAASNGGFQFRSKLLPDHDIAGYQMDNNLKTDWLVRLYDEHGREDLALRGQQTSFLPDGIKTVLPIPEAQGPALFKLEDWHEYRLVCCGTHLTLYVNGRRVAEVMDDDPAQLDRSGILGLQLHSGEPVTVQFKDIMYKRLRPGK